MVTSIKIQECISTVGETGNAPACVRQAAQQLTEYFAGLRKIFNFPYQVTSGTAFQRQVWDALTAIPYGQTRTYGEIARIIGKPGASRAVGAANHHNPLLIVIPCHRVIGAQGALTGFAAGIAIKRDLLALEQRA